MGRAGGWYIWPDVGADIFNKNIVFGIERTK